MHCIYNAWIQSATGAQSRVRARPPTIIPICPAAGVKVSAPAIAFISARAEAGGTMRSFAGSTPSVGKFRVEGSIVVPAIRQSPLAVLFSPYQPNKQVRATSAASGTPSFSQSSRATN